jgi:hypothetical protein
MYLKKWGGRQRGVINVDRNSDTRQGLMNTAINLRVQQTAENFKTDRETVTEERPLVGIWVLISG